VIAAGSVTSFFGGEQIGQLAFGLKTLSEAVVLRNHILKLFEKAAWSDDPEQREALTTMVVVGGGPTGLETAGALYELYNYVLKQEYAKANNLRARVILLEATDHLLAPYPERLRLAALRQLESLGVEVIFGGVVDSVAHDRHPARWPHHRYAHADLVSRDQRLTAWRPARRDLNDGRISVSPNLSVTDLNDVYAVGDIAYLEDQNGEPYPQMIPVANQQGTAGKNILRRMNGQPEMPFHYFDKGTMATIGRSRAVAWVFNRVQLSGYPAWVAWLFLHLVTLMGFATGSACLLAGCELPDV
jgi:NADH dehydrogenase